MKKTLLSFLSLSTGLLAIAQTDNPVVNQWHMTDGTLASYNYYTNPQQSTGETFVQLTDTADILKVCYDGTNAYVNCNVLPSYEMGPFPENPNEA